MGKKESKSEDSDIRIEATKTIWGISAALFGMGIPITAISNANEPIVPILTIIMAGISTLGVWAFGHRFNKKHDNDQLENLNETIHALKNSVSMLEDTLGDELLRRRIESQSPAGVNMSNAQTVHPQQHDAVPPAQNSRVLAQQQMAHATIQPPQQFERHSDRDQQNAN